MHNLAIAWASLSGLHENILFEVGLDFKILILVRPRSLERKLLRHRDHDIRLADGPTVNELWRRWKVFRITLLRSTIHPGSYSVDLALRETAVIGEFMVLGICVPGRPLTFVGFSTNIFV